MKSLLAKLSVVGCLMGSAWQAHAQPARPEMDDKTKAAFEVCKDKLPARDSGTRPTEEQHDAFRTCMQSHGATPPPRGGRIMPQLDDTTKAAFQACKEQMPQPEEGERPSREKLEAFRSCVESKGGQLPHFRPHGDSHG